MITIGEVEASGWIEYYRYDVTTGIIMHGARVPASMLDMQGDNIIVGASIDTTRQYVDIDNLALRDFTDAEMGARDAMLPGQIWSMPARRVTDTRTIDQVRAAAWSRIKDMRDKTVAAHVVVDGRPFHPDLGSLGIAVQMAQLSEGYIVQWTCADNTLVELDIDGLLAVTTAIYAVQQGARQKAEALRSLIDSTTDFDALDKLSWGGV